MIQANIHQAKTQLSKLIERAEAGEEVIIARAGKPVVRLAVVEPDAQPARPKTRWAELAGLFKGQITGASEENWAEMDREVLADFEANLSKPSPEAPER